MEEKELERCKKKTRKKNMKKKKKVVEPREGNGERRCQNNGVLEPHELPPHPQSKKEEKKKPLEKTQKCRGAKSFLETKGTKRI